MTNCRTRKKVTNKTDFEISTKIKSDTNVVISEEKKVIEVNKIDKIFQKKEDENVGEIIIKGKSDSLKDFHFHNIVKGDTLSDIYIKGNADFIIKNRWKQTEVKEAEVSEFKNLNIVAKVARKAVAQSTIKEVAGSIKEVEEEIKVKSFPFPIYLMFVGGLLFAIFLFFVSKKIPNFNFNKKKK